LQPNGSTVLQSGDTLLALSDENALTEARAILMQTRSAESQLTI
jgi:Trk K+ transport system NAD-binding subunit